MSQDVSQWLAEIRTLQRQLADTRKERDQAFASAANWRRLYETEARQRRQEAVEMRSQIQAQQNQPPKTDARSAQLAPLQTQLHAALERCQELTQHLEAERQAHAHTRQTLTTALGEAFDTLKPKTITSRSQPANPRAQNQE